MTALDRYPTRFMQAKRMSVSVIDNVEPNFELNKKKRVKAEIGSPA